jgi:hypothetical protein
MQVTKFFVQSQVWRGLFGVSVLCVATYLGRGHIVDLPVAMPPRVMLGELEMPREVLGGVDQALLPITAETLKEVRRELVRYIWKGEDPYKLSPTTVVDGERTGNIDRVVSDARARKTISIDHRGGVSGFVEYAQNPSGKCLAIWAQGHENAPPNPSILPGAVSYLKKRWAAGCDIIVAPMPFRTEGFALVQSRKEGVVYVPQPVHEAAALIDSPEFSGFRLFFDPLFAALNWLEEAGRRYHRITMAGVSGGGWMSVVYPAIDTRVQEAISVAGSFPMFLRYYPTNGRMRDLGDWEQNFAPFYQIASYYELYLLSALGDRAQTLIYNAFDPCCYSGTRAKLFLPQLERKAREIQVDLRSMIDITSDQHDMSESAISQVLRGD